MRGLSVASIGHGSRHSQQVRQPARGQSVPFVGAGYPQYVGAGRRQPPQFHYRQAPARRAIPIIAPVAPRDVRYAVVVRREQTVAPSDMGKQALFRGYLRDVGSNVAPYGRAHLVSVGNIASRSHFMQEMTEDSNMGRRKVEAESRHGPFRDARGNYMTKARSANVRYQVRNRAIHITINRGVHMGELDVLIGKLAAHRMSVNHSRITLIVGGKKIAGPYGPGGAPGNRAAGAHPKHEHRHHDSRREAERRAHARP